MESDRSGIADIVDLTLDSDVEDEETPPPLQMAQDPIRPRASHPTPSTHMSAYTSTAATASPRSSHTPLPGSTSRTMYTYTSLYAQGKSDSPKTASASAPRPGPPTQRGYVPLPAQANDGANDFDVSGPPGKKRKLSGQGKHTQVPLPKSSLGRASESGTPGAAVSHGNGQSAVQNGSATAARARAGPAPSRLSHSGASNSMANKAPSVQYMNAALKSGGSTTSLLDKIAGSGPRPLQIGRMSGSGSFDLPSPSLSTPGMTPTINSPSTPVQVKPPQAPKSTQNTQGVQTAPEPHGQVRARAARTGSHTLHHQPRTSRPAVPNDNKDSVVSDASLPAVQSIPTNDNNHVQPSPSSAKLKGKKSTVGQFSEQEEHLLIFLKEVKKFPWATITLLFNEDLPERAYHTLQSRYTTKTNKRDRSQDPARLNLPARWAAEADIDWTAIHADTPAPRVRIEASDLTRDAARLTVPKPVVNHQPIEHDYSSGTDSGFRQPRARRGPPVNYDVRKRFRHVQELEDAELDDRSHQYAEMASSPRSESPSQAQATIPGKALVVINEPLEMQFTADDAAIGLLAQKALSGSPFQKLPYLSRSLRKSLQGPPEEWDWDQISSRAWQGTVLHVDFGPSELRHVQNAISRVLHDARLSLHSTQRRHLRSLLKDVSDPKLVQISELVQKDIPGRNSCSIAAFLDDARAGVVADCPHILRLCAARPEKSTSSVHTPSTHSMLRQRELGSRSIRGWRTAATALSYQTRNQLMDSLGPTLTWTGASSDIHTVAWSPDGERFAAGAVAVTDRDSMQYNRPNNLLLCNVLDASIHELAEHTIERERTDSGANASHAMWVSQDPNLYTSVTAVGFAPSGRRMYSAGYDNSLCVWDLDQSPTQPQLAAKFKHSKGGGQVEIMDVNACSEGVLATAARRTSGPSIKLVKFYDDDHEKFARHNFSSQKAEARPGLNIQPQALRFEPNNGRLLLAGFGANVRNDDGFDPTGELCLWDIESLTQIPIHGSKCNVFDVAFNKNRRYMPRFAAGCVANGHVNRGTRSVIRLYDEHIASKYTCPLEIECKALDMNDLVWSPQDEHLIAAGCTDGRVYVWDMRSPDEPLRTLSHGHSLMPLQEGIHHERTDTGVRFLSWGDNATRLYSGSSDGVVKVWDVTRSVEDTFVKDLVTVNSGIMAGAFSPDFSKLVLGEVNGSVNVLEVGRDDVTIKDAEKLRYVPYEGRSNEDRSMDDAAMTADEPDIFDGEGMLRNGQLHVTSMGNFPVRQVVQGPQYPGPFDQSVDAPYLREQALEFQLSMTKPTSPQCDIPACKENIVTVTSEEIGDSKRSNDRIPDQLRIQWTTVEDGSKILPGKSRCTHCGRAARPSASDDLDVPMLCERCSFACFRCGASNPIAPVTTTFICNTCAGVWEIGALGYECIQQPTAAVMKLDVPALRRFGRDRLEERVSLRHTTFGDEINALTDYYHSLTIDRPESPPL